MRYSLFTLGLLVAGTLAAPRSPHVLDEKRCITPWGWVEAEKLEGHEVLSMKIALTISNMNKLEEYLMEVSHPQSEKYSKHWDTKKVAETFPSSKETFSTVIDLLKSAGISEDRASMSQSLGWLNFDATVEEAENL
jgi:tripeptidyl-peptidase-1